MQHEITAQQRLLNAAGNIAEPGFAKKLYWIYDRADIKAPKWRIKEWDYYYIGCADYGLCLTISDAGFVSSLSASVLTFGEHPTMKTAPQWAGFRSGSSICLRLLKKATSPRRSERRTCGLQTMGKSAA